MFASCAAANNFHKKMLKKKLPTRPEWRYRQSLYSPIEAL